MLFGMILYRRFNTVGAVTNNKFLLQFFLGDYPTHGRLTQRIQYGCRAGHWNVQSRRDSRSTHR